MDYEYQVQTIGGSAWDNLEAVGERIQQALEGENTALHFAQGWELWQINTLQNPEVKGVIFIYRRPKT